MPSMTSAAQRFVLFQSLYQASQSSENDWDQLIALLSQGEQAAQRARLDQLADQFASGQRLMLDELRQGGLFREWELRFMQLGLAAGNLGQIYLRLAEHYRLHSVFEKRLRRFLLPLVAFLTAVALGLPKIMASVGAIEKAAQSELMFYGMLPLGLLTGVYVAARTLNGFRGFLSRTAYRLPGLGLALSQYQTYHFINHLGECLAAGFPMTRALKQSARRMPDSPMRQRYLRLAAEVEKGTRFSSALVNSGILEGVPMPAVSAVSDAREVPSCLSLALHDVCERQLRYWSVSLPALLLVLLPYVVILNFLAAAV